MRGRLVPRKIRIPDMSLDDGVATEVIVHCDSQFTKHDVSVEKWREYVYINSVGEERIYHIDWPIDLYIKPTKNGDSHRVVDIDGVTHYPRKDWLGIRWQRQDGAPAVAF